MGASARPPGEARPGWRVLRALGGLLAIDGFDFTDLAPVRARVDAVLASSALPHQPAAVNHAHGSGEGLEAAVFQPIYSGDAMVRRSAPLQATVLACDGALRLHPEDALALGVGQQGQTKLPNGDTVAVRTDGGIARGTVLVPATLAARLPGLVTGTRIRLGASTAASEQG